MAYVIILSLQYLLDLKHNQNTHKMRLIILLFLTIGFGFSMGTEVQAQEESKWKELDKSPLDKAYYPANAAWRNYLTGDDRNQSPKMKIVYSRPGKKDREIFGGLVPYGEEWRVGANEATEITFYQAVEIHGLRIPRGTYTLFATPQIDKWTIALSKQGSIWGGANRDKEMTVATIDVPTMKLKNTQENLAMAFQRVNEETANLVIDWDMTRVKLPIGLYPVNFEDMDASPMDQVYYPSTSAYHNYLKEDELATADRKIKVNYSRPQKKGRKVFGELLKYGEVWRVGANESTEVTFYENVKVGDLSLRAGTYNMYAVVNEKSWDIIFNTDMPAWGPPNRDESKDVGKTTVSTSMDTEDLEVLNIIFEEKSADLVHMVIAWEKTRAHVPITFEKK